MLSSRQRLLVHQRQLYELTFDFLLLVCYHYQKMSSSPWKFLKERRQLSKLRRLGELKSGTRKLSPFERRKKEQKESERKLSERKFYDRVRTHEPQNSDRGFPDVIIPGPQRNLWEYVTIYETLNMI
jgi:hypothetical protein